MKSSIRRLTRIPAILMCIMLTAGSIGVPVSADSSAPVDVSVWLNVRSHISAKRAYTIKLRLTKDLTVTGDNAHNVGNNVEIDLNGHTLNANNLQAFWNEKGTMTIKNGTITIAISDSGGAINEGSSIGVTTPSRPYTITKGFQESGNAKETVFFDDNGQVTELNADGEVVIAKKLDRSWYTERSWNGSKVVSKKVDVKNYKRVAVKMDTGTYLADDDLKLSDTIVISGDVKLILPDNSSIKAEDGIYIKDGATLTVYGQGDKAKTMGKITAKPKSGPGIGGMADTIGGNLVIHGGYIDAEGGTNAAGIGGGNHKSGIRGVTIYGGTVEAYGCSGNAAIGAGEGGNLKGKIKITGGYVKAVTSNHSKNLKRVAAAIGAGAEDSIADLGGGVCDTKIEITGGTVIAQTDEERKGGILPQAIGHGAGDKRNDGITIYEDAVIEHGKNEKSLEPISQADRMKAIDSCCVKITPPGQEDSARKGYDSR